MTDTHKPGHSIEAKSRDSAPDNSAKAKSRGVRPGVSTEKTARGKTKAVSSGSLLTQDIVFYADSPRIDFETVVQWREKRTLLKAGFDTVIDAPQARCEVQYGHLLRNTHRNLPQDRAKFEFCAHKWISLEEAGAGIALLNDCKYGHDVSAEEGGVSMRITLLRSPMAPDEDADQGEQRFTYSLLPFAGSFAESEVIRASYELNSPAAAETAAAPAGKDSDFEHQYSFFTLSGGAVIAECVKAPEPETYKADSKTGKGKAVVIRLYESLGGAAKTSLRFNREIAEAWKTDMLERKEKKLSTRGKELQLEFHAFEIKTLLVELK